MSKNKVHRCEIQRDVVVVIRRRHLAEFYIDVPYFMTHCIASSNKLYIV